MITLTTSSFLQSKKPPQNQVLPLPTYKPIVSYSYLGPRTSLSGSPDGSISGTFIKLRKQGKAACTRALARGTNLGSILSMLKGQVVPQISCPILLFTYYNMIHTHGISKFMAALNDAGVMVTSTPVTVGFGISTAEHVQQIAEWGADGAIVGSAIVKLLGEAKSPEEGLTELEIFTKLLKVALP
ncbi:hypothetical protein AQUCO_04900102v1 [Aquilegia coerulea]|uniref:tryptophan synthase n=1 Tax=Aquilegia coerulea TaxID=218851 RepID=A0A2G5CK72_AQUCA|nr:hypothetical protein AQUCO_04900102v1 [Aquilegia coerulea]